MNKTQNLSKLMALKKFVGFLFAVTFLLSHSGLAKEITITGQVTAKADGKPLPRTTVSVIDSKNITKTDEKGYYEIQAPARGTLVFSRLGMKTLEEPVKNRKEIMVALEPVTIAPVVDQVVVVIPGNVAWKSSEIVLKPVDVVEFKAIGNVCFNQYDVPYSCVGPEGYAPDHPNPVQAYMNDYLGTDYNYCDDPEMEWAHACLIAKDRNGTFYVGSGRTITGRSGPLEIGINDCTLSNTGMYDNSGQFSVVIKVTRGAP